MIPDGLGSHSLGPDGCRHACDLECRRQGRWRPLDDHGRGYFDDWTSRPPVVVGRATAGIGKLALHRSLRVTEQRLLPVSHRSLPIWRPVVRLPHRPSRTSTPSPEVLRRSWSPPGRGGSPTNT